MHKTTKEEMETNYSYDEEDQILHMCTANPRVAKRWKKLGYTVEALSHYDGKKEPRTWVAKGPVEALKLRRVKNGQIIKKSGPARGFPTKKVDPPIDKS